jgi:hypothetical protein
VSCSGRTLPPGKTRYPLNRRRGGPQGRSGQVWKISPPPGFDPRTVQPVGRRYTDYATRPTSNNSGYLYLYYHKLAGSVGGSVTFYQFWKPLSCEFQDKLLCGVSPELMSIKRVLTVHTDCNHFEDSCLKECCTVLTLYRSP